MTRLLSLVRHQLLGMVGVLLLWMSTDRIPHVAAQKGTERSFIIVNDSGSRVESYWVHPQTDERILMSKPDILFGAEQNMDSFRTHKFEIREMPKSSTGKCVAEDGSCQSWYFVVNDNSGQIITIQRDFTLVHADDKTKARDKAAKLVQDCKQQKLDQWKEDSDAAAAVDNSKVLEELSQCVQASVSGALEEGNEEIHFSSNIRKRLGSELGVYACADDTLNTTEEVKMEKFRVGSRKQQQEYSVKVLDEKSTSKIHVIDNFMSPEECQEFEMLLLSQAHDNRNHEPNDNLKASMLVKIPTVHSVVSSVQSRIIDYASRVMEIDVPSKGQEEPIMTKFVGNEGTDEPPDEYRPHCDEKCVGDTYAQGDRIATMTVYCQIPEKGGATTFRNNGIHVKASKGTGLFYTYMDPVKQTTDSGFTEHAECPVVKGDKIVVTQYLRLF
mmetsp:Transcript_11244/g.17380  ORF Transcript_11244/g.17380 Transcript_11244/m.17380 type:complete len:442 (+) Transcript_11244:127-1452(+)|eukprot:CAMPEP_0195281296 /NCGR_PEP_ID=MMETSP0707-20130614/671_1 /TAXON_ID=33640 /ORGANISM="Asterionellopsis glacialis, Strain CCMP134" /LENGTH=441 /DNA_ID=CAMNT_0040340171 /DNA_START=55 /DNA_END=1380 /DNA_ORIENTATION=-